MRDLEFPTGDTVGNLAALLREVRCEAETYLLIDKKGDSKIFCVPM
jgi:hypothetical protein